MLGLNEWICVDCGHASLSMADHHLICECTTCDVPSDEIGLIGEMRRRSGDPRWWESK